MTQLIDTTTEFGQRVIDRLNTEECIWLTTVNARGVPNPSLVWFYWNGESIFLFSQPNQVKVRSIRENPNVALQFNSNADGSNMVVLNGTATLLDRPSAEVMPDGYRNKYRAATEKMGYTEEGILAEYSQPIEIRLEKLRGH
jgi:PPOX class probable F420-dependent enzyme